MRSSGVTTWGLLLLLLPMLGCEDVVIRVPGDAPEPIRFGADEIQRTLAARGLSSRVTDSARDLGPVVIDLGLARSGRDVCPPAPESYAVREDVSADRCVVRAVGRDAVGAMYAALDVAEQLRRVSSASDMAEAVAERSKSPHLPIRGVNPFVLRQGLEQPDSYFHSIDYWRGYLDLLARSRCNFLDLHAAYDVETTEYVNAFPYLFGGLDGDADPPARVEPAKNLAMLKRIVRMAKARGIKVGFMNYVAGASAEPGDGAVKPGQSANEGTVAYTRKCVRRLLAECPDLYMLGFRLGGSGANAEFFEQSYLASTAAARKSMPMYTRTWLCGRTAVMDLASKHAGPFFVETKYNGEHLGLPYVVTSNRVSNWGGGSYQDYVNYPRNYEIVFQVQANGTHRIFHWGDPEFVSRCVRSCRFGGAKGMSVQPMTACYPRTNYFLNAEVLGKPEFRWAYERHWFWYLLWGRLAYDPELPEQVWIDAFKERFGGEAGERVYRGVVAASRIVPLIYAYHCLGAGRQDMAPEFETGDSHRRRCEKDGTARSDWEGDITDFAKVRALDDTAMASIRGYVHAQVSGEADGRFGPQDAVRLWRAAALHAREHIQAAEPSVSRSPQEFRCIKLDIQAVGSLALYYAEKTGAAVALEFYRQTGHYEYLRTAQHRLETAIAVWGYLSTATRLQYLPLLEPIRMGTRRFTWGQEGTDLPRDLAAIRRLQEDFGASVRAMFKEDLHELAKELGMYPARSRKELMHRKEELEKLFARTPPIIGHCPVFRALPGRALRIAVTLKTVAKKLPTWLWYRRAGDKAFNKIDMVQRKDAQTYMAFIPAEAMAPGKVEYYVECGRGKGRAVWPAKGGEEPQVVDVSADRTKPVIEPIPVSGRTRGSRVTIRAKIADDSPLARAVLHCKPMPSYETWEAVEMTARDGLFEADVPLTPRGLLYYFEAADRHGNAVVYPDFRERTPYYTIQCWVPAWVEHGIVSLEEGTETYSPAAGERPFSDSDLKIEKISVDLKGLTGVRLSKGVCQRAVISGGGGFAVRFRLSRPARLFVGFGKDTPGWCPRRPSWRSCPKMELKLGKYTLDVCSRDFQPGVHAFAFPRGCGVILGFRALKPSEKDK